jgi:catechol 2,3-dioxygenase-like lactoylglutathione lyase family enzyme
VIQRLSHTTIFVTDQNAAYDFYVNKLEFEVRTDATMGDFRWLTVGPKGQPELEIVLMPLCPNQHMDAETVETMRKLLAKGAFGAGVFDTADIDKTYQEMKARGVEFLSPPEKKFYGTEAIFRDNSGNWFSLSQK